MLRKVLMALVWGGVISVQAQDSISAKFCSPFDFPLQSSANFGELRPNHFHNGLDIKTQGVVGKPIHSIADGYVSRVACAARWLRSGDCSSRIPTGMTSGLRARGGVRSAGSERYVRRLSVCATRLLSAICSSRSRDQFSGEELARRRLP